MLKKSKAPGLVLSLPSLTPAFADYRVELTNNGFYTYAYVNGDGSMKAAGQAVLNQNSDEPIKPLK